MQKQTPNTRATPRVYVAKSNSKHACTDCDMLCTRTYRPLSRYHPGYDEEEDVPAIALRYVSGRLSRDK